MPQRTIDDELPSVSTVSGDVVPPVGWEEVIGVDEVGRGPLAGPVVTAAVLLPSGHGLTELADSKKLSAKKRVRLDAAIRECAVFSISWASVEEIDRLNIFQATMLAMTRAVDALPKFACNGTRTVLVDGNHCPKWQWHSRAVIGGDGLHPAISAASILAKQFRDAWMENAARTYPQYGWEGNKGYGTRAHMQALKEYGPTFWHRTSFAPVAQCQLPMAMPTERQKIFD